MSKSVKRVTRAARELGIPGEIVRMGESTRTAEDAARACGCAVGQIVKSLIFKGRDTGDLILLLVSGANRVDMEKAAAAVGQSLDRADANEVRARTGFAIGGVSPIGHLEAPLIWMDRALQQYEWPGNVRELENVIERASIIREDSRITVKDLPAEIAPAAVSAAARSTGKVPTRTRGKGTASSQPRRRETPIRPGSFISSRKNERSAPGWARLL